jgi:3-phenylpropionate/cinnamic acid dioxygenase small subunit
MPTESLRYKIVDPIYQEVVDFLHHEADLLQSGEFRRWLDLMADDLIYLAPVRVTCRRAEGPGFVESMSHFDENLASLTMRVKRLETGYAPVENPPPRVRRFVTNVQVSVGESQNEVRAKSNILLIIVRGDESGPLMVSGERKDVLRRSPQGLRLARREILLDQTTIRLDNLAVFF